MIISISSLFNDCISNNPNLVLHTTDQPAVLRVLLWALLVRVLPDHGGQQIRVLELEVEGGVAQRLDLGELLAGRPVPVPETRQVHAVDPLTLASS